MKTLLQKIFRFFRLPIIRLPLVFGTIGLAVYGAYTLFFAPPPTEPVQTTSEMTVTKVPFFDSIHITGQAELANEQKLRFGQTGKITHIYHKVGDTVEEGAILASVDKREFYQELEQVQKRIANTEKDLQEEYAKASGIEGQRMIREIASMERKLAEAEEEFERMMRLSREKSEEKQLDLNAKKRELRTLQEKYQLDEVTIAKEEASQDTLIASKIESGQKSITQTIQSAHVSIAEIRNIHKGVNGIFGFDPSLLTSEERWWVTYVARDVPGIRNNVEIIWREIRDELPAYMTIINSIERDSTNPTDALWLINTELRIYKLVLEMLDISRQALDGTIPDGYGITESTLTELKNTISTLRSTTSSKITALTELRDTILIIDSPEKIKASFLAELQSKKFALEALADSIKKLELQIHEESIDFQTVGTHSISKALQREILDKQSAIQDQKDAIQTKKEDLQKLQSGKSDTIENLKNTLQDQKVELEKMRTKEELYEIRAPFAGTIRSIKMQVGDILGGDSSDNEKVILLENADIIHIKASLNQLDIIKVEMGQEATLTFDAIPGAELTGQVTEIASTPNNMDSSLAMYSITIAAERGEYPIYSGMNAQVNIVIDERDAVLMIPLTAVSQDPETGESYVLLIEKNGNKKKTPVVTGSISQNMIEIVEGLSEWDRIQIVDFDANPYTHSDFTSAW